MIWQRNEFKQTHTNNKNIIVAHVHHEAYTQWTMTKNTAWFNDSAKKRNKKKTTKRVRVKQIHEIDSNQCNACIHWITQISFVLRKIKSLLFYATRCVFFCVCLSLSWFLSTTTTISKICKNSTVHLPKDPLVVIGLLMCASIISVITIINKQKLSVTTDHTHTYTHSQTSSLNDEI